MPNPRFQHLEPARREQILETAARLFAQHGYEEASLNQILGEAGLSKGVAYYYFNDKADLFATVAEWAFGDLFDRLSSVYQALEAESFWDRLLEHTLSLVIEALERPWALGLTKAVMRLPEELARSGPLAPLYERGMASMRALIGRGRELGVIRDDIPDELAIAWVTALDLASDRFMVPRLKRVDPGQLEAWSRLSIDLIRRVLAPCEGQQTPWLGLLEPVEDRP